MRIHILGICGTFMGGLAILARSLGHEVSGSDENVYPPMSQALKAAGIEIQLGYDPAHLKPAPDLVLIGNAMSRGNAAVEYVFNHNLAFQSGPQWLSDNVLRDRHVIVATGTHGKTTVTSMVAWILQHAGLEPGFLVGGMPKNFQQTAQLGGQQYFVIEGDEYDTAFFDKRSKFIHYRPRTLIMNNLEFDHADIFSDLEMIKKQFQYLLRIVPGSGMVLYGSQDKNLHDVIKRGCWSAQQSFGENGVWHAEKVNRDGSQFELWHRDQKLGTVEWEMVGPHNVNNALAAVAGAHHVGVPALDALAALNTFKGVRRRMELCGEVGGITIYDDFAHHPTEIASTLNGLRAKVGSKRIVAVLQFGSNSMASGAHRANLPAALKLADHVVMLQPSAEWDSRVLMQELSAPSKMCDSVTTIIDYLHKELKSDDQVLIMSNKGFDGIQQRLLTRLQQRHGVNEV